MKQTRTISFPCTMTMLAILACAALVCLSLARPADAIPMQASGACADSIKSCKKPVKFISRDNACYTFACEYGEATQHNIHVSDQSDVRNLLQMARESGN